MKKFTITFIFTFFCFKFVFAQATNIFSTNVEAFNVMKGNYDPKKYEATVPIKDPNVISAGLLNSINADTLKSYILKLAAFKNRNAGSDTLSSTEGFGAARKWVFGKFKEFSIQNEDRLLPSYLQFTQSICNVNSHKNIFAVLPGTDITDNRIILVEAHMDSRCEGLCDINCVAEGVEDNATGTALVLELARVMSKYSYNHTIVFLITTAEEQGLFGAQAFNDYAKKQAIKIKSVQNNDVIGGIICGKTASEPGCQGFNTIDSVHVRLFSNGGFNSAHKQYARFIKLEYKEQVEKLSKIKSLIAIMSPEERSGRGGDHIPFRQGGFTSMRFTSANEHGNADVSVANYSDRQHSHRDVLGTDNDGNGDVDSFYVNFNYLARNTIINGNALAMNALGPKTPDFTVSASGNNTLNVTITKEVEYKTYRFAVRSLTHDWDTVFTFSGINATFNYPFTKTLYVSVASVNEENIESLFSKEILITTTETKDVLKNEGIILMQNKPNPFDESTVISVFVETDKTLKEAKIRVTDMKGGLIKEMPITLNQGMNEVLYEHGYYVVGVMQYTLIIDGRPIETKSMVFAN